MVNKSFRILATGLMILSGLSVHQLRYRLSSVNNIHDTAVCSSDCAFRPLPTMQ